MADPGAAGPRAAGPARPGVLAALRRRAGRLLRSPRVTAATERLAPRSVRTRTTIAACAAVAVVLLAASAAVVLLMRVNLHRTVDTAAREQAGAVAVTAAQGPLPHVLPLGPGADFIQVTDASGAVVAASQNLAGRPALTGADDGHDGFDLGMFGGEHHQRVTTLTADTPNGPVTVRVGASLHTADTAEDLTTAALGGLSAVLVATVGAVTWRATGRALRPVEAIRAEVAAIGDRDLARRVPEPGSEDEIARLAHTMNAMLDRLEAAGVRQRRFIADASHELRSPLAVLRTQLEVAHTHPDPAVRADLVAGALQDTDRLQSLAADLLLLARLDSTGHNGPAEELDLAELVRTCLDGRAPGRTEVVAELADGVVVTGNPMWLGRLLTNLLDNAERHARHRVTVRLALDGATGRAVLDVADDGPGVPSAEREEVFERFTRLDDARSRDDGGTGLGLSIARDIAALHGGTLTIEDTPGGCTFRTRLPAGHRR
ncbi:HAMP domain-containing histidine kinase [Kitasatospora purpeofusca]|uniref:sensor histidine kinase n=1 Tax=Kitasatospora purpeofusca TaxID=67352 RepID=UPI0022522999|nr:HAMP domain-containing sensor histidine kinase [Kitasatospora purpeofusca]MCX4690097.1 HAMP domain-containing histidine kinase [Kitasatospora purpeofusca]